MSLTRLSANHPAALLAMATFVIVVGVTAIVGLPIQMLPDIEYPEIHINTSWRSASPQEIETNIIEPQEEALRNVPGVTHMTSSMSSGNAGLTLRFDIGSDLQQATIDVMSALNNVSALPPDADEPRLQVGGFENPVATLLVHSRTQTRDVDVTAFQDIIDSHVTPQLLNVPGVQRVDLRSEREPIVLITFDPYRAAALGVQVADIADTVTRAVNSTGGTASVGRRQYTVRFLGGFDLAQLEGLIVSRNGAQPVYLRDIATVSTELYPRSGYTYRTGFPAYYIRLQGKYGANAVSILDEINEVIHTLNAGVLAERNLQLVLSFDASVHIRRAINLVNTNLLVGVLLALGLLWTFLRGARATLLIALTIPFSLLAAFVAMRLLGRSINVVSLAGLAFSVGLVLDAAIIVQENILRLRQDGRSQDQAIREGPSQVVGALFASTVTSVAIFLPIVFMRGLEGQLFADLALTLSVAVATSTIAALTILPVASRYLLKNAVLNDPWQPAWTTITARIAALTDTPLRRALWIVGLISTPLLTVAVLAPRVDLLPQADGDGVIVSFSLPESMSLGTIRRELMEPIIERLQPHVDGTADYGIRGYNLFSFGPDATGVFIYPDNPREAEALMELLRERLSVGLPGVSTFVSRASLLNIGIGGGRNIDIDLQGPQLQPLMQAARAGSAAINEQLSGWSARAIPGITLSKPELHLQPDDWRISQAGLNRAQVGDAIRAFTGGILAGRYFDGNESSDVIVWGGNWDNPEDLAGLPVHTPDAGIQVIGELAPLARSVGPTRLRRVNGQRTITLQVLPPAGITMEEALVQLRSVVEPSLVAAMPADATTQYTGTVDQLGSAMRDMAKNFALAVLMLLLIMAAMFRSLRDSLIVVMTMPLAVVGGVLALKVLNLFTYQSLDLLTMVGFIIMLGLVVNNAILLVHQTRVAERNGVMRHAAVAQAIRIRARPIFMSTLTSIVGMLPLVVVPGAGSEIYRGLATVIVGGMSLSAVFTLILLPSVLRCGRAAETAQLTDVSGTTQVAA